jgi:putative transposase
MDEGYRVSRKRIKRLYYDVMGFRAIMPRKHTSRRNKEHKVYPYLIRNFKVDHSNQVMATDITYIPMRNRFMYLMLLLI